MAVRPMSVGELIDGGFQLMKRRLSVLVKIAAIVVVPVQVLIVLIQLSSRVDSNSITSTDALGDPHFNAGNFRAFVAGTILVFLLGFLAQIIAAGAMTHVVSNDYLGGLTDSSTSIRFAFRRFFALLVSGILIALGTLAGSIACILPGIFLSIAWSVATPALIVEHLGPARALSRSMRLVRPRWWPTFGFRILLQLMTVIPGLFITIPVGLFFGSNTTSAIIAGGVATTVISLFVTPFSAATIVLLYFDLRVRNEGFDLQMLAHSLDLPAPQFDPRAQQPTPSLNTSNWASPTPPPPPTWGRADVPPPPAPPGPNPSSTPPSTTPPSSTNPPV